MLRNLASSLILTERDAELDDNTPKVKGRIVTTLPKAKEVRPLVEKCVTIARKSLEHEQEAEQYATSAGRGTDQWREWRQSEAWQQWCAARAPVVTARRRALQLLGDKQAVRILFDEIAPRYVDRSGGYTRVLRVAKPRLGDAGVQAILEFVGTNDREAQVSEEPTFADIEAPESDAIPQSAVTENETGEAADEQAADATDQEPATDAERQDEQGETKE